MNTGNVALVVAHPAHVLTIAGVVQRMRPHMLILTCSDTNESQAQVKIVRSGLKVLGLTDRTTFLNVHERESYQWAHQGLTAPFFDVRRQIFAWLRSVQPTAVVGDGFECSNFQHDVGRLLLDSALREYRRECPEVENYEIPLACRTSLDEQEVRFQVFPEGDYDQLELSESEVTNKERLIRWALPQSEFITRVAPLFPSIHTEPFRAVPWNRNYRQPPPGLQKHYDSRGHELVTKGVYAQPILFDQHFLPLVDALLDCTSDGAGHVAAA